MIYERKLLEKIRRWVDKKAIIVVTGMRRVGKTTLFKMLYDEIKSENKVFLDIENPITQRLFQEKDYNNILINLKQYNITDKEKSYIFLDEIQAFPDIVKVIKYLFDHYETTLSQRAKALNVSERYVVSQNWHDSTDIIMAADL
jgi:predicted AAA+ superfamily ATPase